MQDFNLPGSLGNRNPQVTTGAIGSSASPTAGQIPELPVLRPISVSTVGQQVRVSDLNNKLVATGKSTDMLSQATTAALSQKAQAVVLFSQPKNLFDAIVSAEQQRVILEATAKQPNLTRLSLVDTQQVTLRNAVISAISQQSVTLKLTPPLSNLDQVTLDFKNLPAGLKVGQPVQVQVQQMGDKWIARLIVPDSASSPPKGPQASEPLAQTSSQIIHKGAPANAFVTETPIDSREPLIRALVTNILQTGINLNQAPKLVESLMRVLTKTPSVIASGSQTTVKNSSQQLQNLNPSLLQQTVANILQQPSNPATLQVSAKGKMTVTSQLPVAQLPLEQTTRNPQQPRDTNSLQNLTSTAERNIERFFALPDGQKKQLLEVLKSLPISKADPHQATSTGPASPTSDRVTVKGIDTSDLRTTTVADIKSAVPKAFVEQLSVLIRQHFVNAAPVTESAATLTQTLTQLTQSSEAGIRELGKNLQQAILPLVSKKEPDPAQIQALLQMPALPISTASLTQIAPVNNMVSGLIALLQISLATRTPQRHSTTADKLGGALSQLIQTATAVSSGNTAVQPSTQANSNARVLQEFTQAEQRNQLLRTLSKTLSNHHYSKLASAEAALQGTESLYYSLPSFANSSQRDIELLVKRELGNKKSKSANSEQTSTWHLTMLMDIGEFGEMLSKCKLQEHQLELDIYTSSEALRIRVMDMLPLLNKRLDSLGLDIISTHCQLGKIPETLRPKPYQLLHTQA